MCKTFLDYQTDSGSLMSKHIVAIHQPNYLPWLGFFYKIARCDQFVLLDHVPFSKNSIQNRNRIKTPSGEHWITVPVLTKGRLNQPTNAVEINNNTKWNTSNWNSIRQNYRKAPEFSRYARYFEDLYNHKWKKLVDLSETIIRFVIRELKIETEITKSSDLNPEGTSTDMLIDICKKLNAKAYLSGKGGLKYQSEEKFQEAGIMLSYHDFQHPVYPQLYGEFVSHLSIIDLLFNCGVSSSSILMRQSNVLHRNTQ